MSDNPTREQPEAMHGTRPSGAADIQSRYYTDTAAAYDAMHVRDQDGHDDALRVISALIDQFEICSVLDVGCGTGRAVRHFRTRHAGLHVYGIEPIQALIRQAVEVHRVPARGIVCGVADALNTRPDDEPVMIWAAHYAASTNGRGLDRVGIAPSTSLEYLPRDRARAKIQALGAAAARGALTDPEELGMVIDPRATDARSAALGEYVPPSRRPGATARSAR